MMLTEMPLVYAGSGFPWGLLIIGGILYLLWRNGMFDGRGRRGPDWRNGGGHGPGYGPGYGPPQFPEGPSPAQGGGPGFRGPREFFDEWHRQAHAADAQAQAPVAPQAPPAPPAAPAPEAPAPGNGEPFR